MFKLSENINTNKIFIINRSELEGRIDSTFYVNRPDFHNTIRLSKIAKIKGGKRIPKDADYSDIDTHNLYLRVTDIDESTEFNYLNFKNISDELYEKLKRYEVFENELIISIAGTVGKTKVVRNIPNGKRIILTENCVKILTDTAVLPQYLNIVLQTNFLQKQIELSYIQTTIPKLGIDKIFGLKIPQIPPLEIQQQIVELYETAYTEKQQKEAEAQRLLDSIDDYLLGELGITLPKEEEYLQQPINKDNSYNLDKDNLLVKKGRLFLTNLTEVTGKRIDPDYYSVFYKRTIAIIKKGKYPTNAISNNCLNIFSGKTPASSEYSKEKSLYPIIKVSSYTDYKIDIEKVAFALNKQSLSVVKGDIFILSAAHQAEYVGKHIKYLEESPENSTSFVGELLCVRADETKLLSNYLFPLLNIVLYKILINREKTGQTSHIYPKDIGNIEIPLPPLEKQNEIATYISQIRSKANLLKREGKEILEQAKKEVERMILGN
ncbi:HsdS polypeptide [Capnocytophaga sp. HP1101]